jgi:hypothetical protein
MPTNPSQYAVNITESSVAYLSSSDDEIKRIKFARRKRPTPGCIRMSAGCGIVG